ncbi:MAG: UvrD-helicase domain-containing protein [Myxococcota bacterium]
MGNESFDKPLQLAALGASLHDSWQHFCMSTTQAAANIVVCAGAGAGKTHALVYHYLLALLGLETSNSKPMDPQRIVAVTFTENAACEMRERVASTIMDLIQQRGDNPLLLQLQQQAQQLHAAMPQPDTLQTLWEGVQQAPICTFHSLCATLLRRYGDVIGVQPHFTLLDELQQQQLLQQCCLAVLLPAVRNNNQALQQLIARLGLQDVGGRTGVVSALCQLYRQMQEHGVQPQHAALACAATTQQSSHGLAQLQQALSQLQQQCDAATQPCMKQLQQAYSKLQSLVVDNQTPLPDKQSAVSLAFEQCMQLLAGLGRSDSVRGCKRALQLLGNQLCNGVILPQQLAVRSALQQLHRQLLDHKLQAQTLGFGDLLQLTVALLCDHPNVRQQAQQNIDKLLVDECQDTNALQAKLLLLLTQRRSSAMQPLASRQLLQQQLPLQPGMLFVVGDPKQSIYGFRGADVQLFEQLSCKVTQEAAGKRQYLTTCRRCQAHIVMLVNRVAQATLPAGQDGVPFTPQDELQPFRTAAPHSNAKQLDNQASQADSNTTTQQAGQLWQLQLHSGQDANAAMNKALASQLLQLLQHKQATAADIAVLVRRQRMGQQIQQQLQRVGIPTYLVGGDPLFLRQEIADTVAALRLLLHPHDELATLIVLRSAFVALHDADLLTLFAAQPRQQAGLTWLQVVQANKTAKLNPRSQARIAAFAQLLQQLRAQLHTTNIGAIGHTLLQQSEYGLSLAADAKGSRRLHSLQQFLWQGYCLAQDPCVVIQQWWSLLQQAQQPAAPADDTAAHNAVRIMTIHQAKGLEFPIVVLADTVTTGATETQDLLFDPDVGLAVGVRGQAIATCATKSPAHAASQLPLAIDAVRQRRRQRVHAELARVLYVAMTRARDQLYIMDAKPCDCKKAYARQGSLQYLLLQAQQQHTADFDRLMPTIKLQVAADSSQTTLQQQPTAATATQQHPPPAHTTCPACSHGPIAPTAVGTLRITPSQLLYAASNPPSPAAAPNPSADSHTNQFGATVHYSPADLGRLTHALVAAASLQLPQNSQQLCAKQINSWLQCALADRGMRPNNPQAQKAMQLARDTLLGPVGQMLLQATWFSFEHAIAYPIQQAIVEGYADLVLQGPWGTGVIDFKLSARTAALHSTRLQLYAYAHAFAQKDCTTAIWVAACVLGSSQPLQRLPYNPQARTLLHRSIQERICQVTATPLCSP